MTTRNDVVDALAAGVPFVAIMFLWIVVLGVVYGGFVLVWPSVPDAEPWVHLGVYLLPLIGYLGHTLQQARR